MYKKLQFRTILLPCKKCVTEKKLYVNKGCNLLNSYLLTIFLLKNSPAIDHKTVPEIVHQISPNCPRIVPQLALTCRENFHVHPCVFYVDVGPKIFFFQILCHKNSIAKCPPNHLAWLPAFCFCHLTFSGFFW